MIRRSMLLVWLVLTHFCVLAQPPATGMNRTDAQGRKQGTWAKTWENGQDRYSGQFKDDRPVGLFHHFDEKGRLITLMDHGDGTGPSRAVHYYETGREMAKGNYVEQRRDSTWRYFGPEGQLRKVERYRSGILQGEQVTYYPNGQPAEKEERLDGLLHGPVTSWFDSGKVKSESTYVHGEPEGRMTFYFPSGTKEIEGNLVNGSRDGTWYYFNEDGTIQLQMLYAKGELKKERKENGLFREYYDDEQLKSEETYRKGKREGAFKEYHSNGKWVMKPLPADPVNGAPADVQRVLEGQTLKREGNYVNDLLEGEVKEYDERGKVIKVSRYVAGVEQ
jgi:antitoxin component YwqK of YwqJK toxin-antitoxin module